MTLPLPIGEDGQTVLQSTANLTYLGMKVSKNGVNTRTRPEFLPLSIAGLRQMLRTEGLPAPLLMNLARAKGWAAVSYGMEVGIPSCAEVGHLCRLWQRAARRAFHVPTRVHGCEVQRELGLLNHPWWFLVKRLVAYYVRKLSVFSVNQHLRSVLLHVEYFRVEVETFFEPVGITWTDLQLD